MVHVVIGHFGLGIPLHDKFIFQLYDIGLIQILLLAKHQVFKNEAFADGVIVGVDVALDLENGHVSPGLQVLFVFRVHQPVNGKLVIQFGLFPGDGGRVVSLVVLIGLQFWLFGFWRRRWVVGLVMPSHGDGDALDSLLGTGFGE